jgi:hypothetical protein
VGRSSKQEEVGKAFEQGVTVTSAKSIPVGFWLVPAPPFHQVFTEVIDLLARELDAAPFEPHVSLYVDRKRADEDVAALLLDVTAGIDEITLVAVSTEHTEAFYKTLFVAFAPDSRPHILMHRLRERSANPVDFPLVPHLSLLYKDVPRETRARLAGRYSYRGQPILFDHIAAVRPGAGEDDFSDIRRWDVWLRQRLRGPNAS